MDTQIYKVSAQVVDPSETVTYDKFGNAESKVKTINFYLATGDEYNAATEVIAWLATGYGDHVLKGLAIGRMEGTVLL